MIFPDRDTNSFDEEDVNENWLDHTDQMLIDPDVHRLYSKKQIGKTLNQIYCNTYTDEASHR